MGEVKLNWTLEDSESCKGCPILAQEFHWPNRFVCFLGFTLKQRNKGEVTPDYVSAYKPTDLDPGKVRPAICKRKATP